jgi:hypothetical protein
MLFYKHLMLAFTQIEMELLRLLCLSLFPKKYKRYCIVGVDDITCLPHACEPIARQDAG